MVEIIIENKQITGAVNCAAPTNPTNKEFMKSLRKSVGMPFGIPQPKILLKIRAWIMRTESELILKSTWVSLKKVLDEGFKFKTAKVALEDLMKKQNN